MKTKLTPKSIATSALLMMSLAGAGCGPQPPEAPPPAVPTVSAAPAGDSCSKDTDCKGDRVCDNSACVAAKK